MSKIRVLIVEDEPVVAATLRRMLIKLDYDVVGSATTYELALYDLERLMPDVVLLDICLEGAKSGVDVAEHMHNNHRIPFIYLTALADQDTLAKAKRTEPAGYILKPFDENDIRVNLEISLYNHAQREKLEFPTPDWNEINKRLDIPLTKREIDVLKELFEGKTNAKIASDLFLSVNTVKSHLIRLYQKLDVTARTEALAKVRMVYRLSPV